MPVRQSIIAIAIAAIASVAPAEPSKAPASKAVEAGQGDKPVIVASATTQVTPAPVVDAQAPAPARKARTARIGTCRCGGQTPAEN